MNSLVTYEIDKNSINISRSFRPLGLTQQQPLMQYMHQWIGKKITHSCIRTEQIDLMSFCHFLSVSLSFFHAFKHTHTHKLIQIRIHIKQTESRSVSVCLRFPSNYPSAHLLVELKSVTLSGKLLAGLTTLAEQKAKEILGKPQVANCCYLFICVFFFFGCVCCVYSCLLFGSDLWGEGCGEGIGQL